MFPCFGLAAIPHHLTTIESFWREGENEMFAGRFINAFYNFYFVLEGLYGNRKWRNDDLEAEFNASAELKASLDHLVLSRDGQSAVPTRNFQTHIEPS